MFGDYSIATASRHPSSLPYQETLDLSESPTYAEPACDAFRMYSRQLSINQLSQRFGEQQLHDDMSFQARSRPRIPFCADDLTASDRPEPKYVGSVSSSRRRLQRQQGARMLCDSAHLRNIQEMVEKMVRSKDQCAVSVSSPLRIELSDGDDLPDPGDDEGYSSLEDHTASKQISSSSSSSSSSSPGSSIGCDLKYKRSTDFPTKACVSKNVRIRKARTRCHAK